MSASAAKHIIPRDISWLSFNARVLQEASDPSVPLIERIRFLGIHSNNQDEFFRVRVATLKRMLEVMKKGTKAAMHLESSPEEILERIQSIVLLQQAEFARIWDSIVVELAQEGILLRNETQLNKEQQEYVEEFYDDKVSASVIPLMIEDIQQIPYLRDKSIYLAVVMRRKDSAYQQRYALIEIPAKAIGRFVQLPSPMGQQHIILLEDIIRYNLPNIFRHFGYDHYTAHLFKVTKDAEIDIDNDISIDLTAKIERGIKKRREGKPVRFVYDKEMDAGMLEYLMRRMNLSNRDNIIPGGRIHNFRHFMDFPGILKQKRIRTKPFTHPALDADLRITDVILKQDVLLSLPYHDFTSVIHLLREAAMDASVQSIRITAYRLASNSKIVNALINAVRNGKKVIVILELRARFDEEANLDWKKVLEQEGVTVKTGVPNMKVHAKLCIIKKKHEGRIISYGFVSTGNLNEKTATVYSDYCLLTSSRLIMADVTRIFNYLEKPADGIMPLRNCHTLWVCPVNFRKQLSGAIHREIQAAKNGKKAGIIIKANSISDDTTIQLLYKAAQAGVKVEMIIRGIFCPVFEKLKPRPAKKPYCISIVDEYLEHARVMAFHNGGKPSVYLSSADLMVRNLDHRIEAAVPVLDKKIANRIIKMLRIQLSDNTKARLLDQDLKNVYVEPEGDLPVKSQLAIYNYLQEAASQYAAEQTNSNAAQLQADINK